MCDWGSCSFHRRLHVLVSLHHFLIPPRALAMAPMRSMRSLGSAKRLPMLQVSLAASSAEMCVLCKIYT